MTEYRSVLERAGSNAPSPQVDLERVLRRRDRRRRNQRITAGVAGLAFFAAAILVVTGGPSFDRTKTPPVPGGGETGPTVTGPTQTGPTEAGQSHSAWHVTDDDIALGTSFLEAWVDGDGETLAAMIDPAGAFDGFEPGILPALQDWLRAEGWTFRGDGCGRHVDTAWEDDLGLGYVGCGLTFENDLTRALEMPPMEAGLAIYMDGGRIEAASTTDGVRVDSMFRSPDTERLVQEPFGAVWDMFIGWISTSHPDDFGRMYDSVGGYPLLDPGSIELWERYTDEFVASPDAARRYFTEWMANQPLEVRASHVCFSVQTRFWASAEADGLHGRALDAALADVSEERLAELLALPIETEADRATMDAFVPLSERLTEIFREKAAGREMALVDGLPERLFVEHQIEGLFPGCWFSLGG